MNNVFVDVTCVCEWEKNVSSTFFKSWWVRTWHKLQYNEPNCVAQMLTGPAVKWNSVSEDWLALLHVKLIKSQPLFSKVKWQKNGMSLFT
jgi:hypothetical protein